MDEKKKMDALKGLVKTLSLGAVGGLVFQFLKLPLPWMIGPLLVVAVCQAMNLRLQLPKPLRNGGQIIIGTALGATFTVVVVQQLAAYWSSVVMSLVVVVVLGVFCSWLLSRWTGLEFKTSFFATAMGGSTEMALISEKLGGRTEYVAAAHSVRILWIVLAIPFLFKFFEIGTPVQFDFKSSVVNYADLLLLITSSVVLGYFVNKAGVPNGWLIGPIISAATFSLSGWMPVEVPRWLVNIGQLLIGCALGIKFNRQFFKAAPRYLFISSVITVFSMAVMALFALALHQLYPLDVYTLLLATSPGGVAEMTMTAYALNFSVPVVTVFHVCRVIFMSTTTGLMYRVLQRYFT